MSEKNASTQSNKEEENENNNESEEFNLIDELDDNCDIEKLKEINAKSVDLIFEEKPQKSLDILKKLETFLENKIIDVKSVVEKKYIIIILHNIACCFQKLKDYENCITYLESAIYHFDKLIEEKHKIIIKEEYFDSLIKIHNYNYEKKLLGDLILELRFCAKFHLQMGVVLAEAKRHVDSLKHIKLAALICEDNLIKTTYLYNQIKDSLLNNNKNENSELTSIKQQIKKNYKIIIELNKRILNLRNNNILKNNKKCINNCNGKNCKKNMKSMYNNNYLYIKNVITKIVKNSSNKNQNDLPYNHFDSYLNYRKNEINNYQQNITTLNDVKIIFENNFNQKDDWIKLLNIENIMYLSALNYDDLDLESDPKYELLRDSILEKVIMLTVSYFCLANELKFFCKDKNKNNINGEYYLLNAINLSILFLPVSCPIIRHYIMTYYKNYGHGMEIIPEGEIIDYKKDIIKKEIDLTNDEENKNKKIKDKFVGQDSLYFIRTQKINRIIKEDNNSYFTINSELYRSKSKSSKNDFYSSDYSENYYTLKKKNDNNNKICLGDKKLSDNKLVNSANCKPNIKKLQIINISENNILNKNILLKKYKRGNNIINTSKMSNSASSSNVSIENDNYINITNGNFDLIPNNNFIERVNKSKISENKAPKFKLNFNNINLNNDFSDNLNNNSGSLTAHTQSQIINKLSTGKKNKNEKDKKAINSDKKKNISKINITNKFSNKTSINIQLNNNCKTNTNINININNLERKLNNNKFSIKNFNKISVQNLGFKTERLHLKGSNITNTQRKIIYKNPINKNTSKKYIKIKKPNNSINDEKLCNINTMSNISKYFNVKNSKLMEKKTLTDRFIVQINKKLKEKGIKMKKNITYNSNSPFTKRKVNNQIYNNYIRKKKKEKNPIKLIQNNNKENTGKYSSYSDNQKNNLSNGNNSNIRNFYSNDSNIEEFSLGSKKVYRVKGQFHQVEKRSINKKTEKERINKYLKNINLIKKLINNNNKSNMNEKTFNKEINISNQKKFYQVLKKINILPDNQGKIHTVNVKNQK